eukprot:387546_1
MIMNSTKYLFVAFALIYCQFHSILAQCGNSGITYCDIDTTLRNQIIPLLQQNNGALIGSVVRLVFHDCAGSSTQQNGPISICNGCLALNDPHNTGIEELAVDPIDNIYTAISPNNWSSRMSLADFWADVATIALQYATTLAGNTLPNIPFFKNRIDCATSPDCASDGKQFPNEKLGWRTNVEWFTDNFDFTEQEYVAILGAHSLGQVHIEYSGYGTAPWNGKQSQFSNRFYSELLQPKRGSNWHQQQTSTGLYEWRNNPKGNHVMLNSDIALFKNIDGDITDVNTGQVSCNNVNIQTCQYSNSPGQQHVLKYAANVQDFYNDFVPVFIKMITMGYSGSQLEELIIN